jgi:hypothetical protein
MGARPRRADREDSVRRTVYVSDIDQHVSTPNKVALELIFCVMSFNFLLVALQVTEQKLAEVFSTCGQVSSMILLRKCHGRSFFSILIVILSLIRSPCDLIIRQFR